MSGPGAALLPSAPSFLRVLLGRAPGRGLALLLCARLRVAGCLTRLWLCLRRAVLSACIYDACVQCRCGAGCVAHVICNSLGFTCRFSRFTACPTSRNSHVLVITSKGNLFFYFSFFFFLF